MSRGRAPDLGYARPRLEYVGLRVDLLLHEAIREASREDRKTVSRWVRDLIDQELEQRRQLRLAGQMVIGGHALERIGEEG